MDAVRVKSDICDIGLNFATKLLPFFGRNRSAKSDSTASGRYRKRLTGLARNRNSAFNPNEVARILTPGGTFLTQQVYGLWAEDLLAAFDKEIPDRSANGGANLKGGIWRGLRLIPCNSLPPLRLVLTFVLRATPFAVLQRLRIS